MIKYVITIFFFLSIYGLYASRTNDEPLEESVSSIQVALLLDSSGSMSGLIEQAKSQLWDIVDEFTSLEYEGETPRIEIALYDYGHGSYGVFKGYIKQLTSFTTDMDRVSKQLFDLTIGGSQEYCPLVIYKSLKDLEWNESSNAIRMIYIAGNETFQQGPTSIQKACDEAIRNNVKINTIYCGDYDEGIRTFWQSSAVCGGGIYANIDHNEKTVFVSSPFDDEIAKLDKLLNATYIAYGKEGNDYLANQRSQDLNASSYSKANFVKRNKFKSSKNYVNDHWDLVDAYKSDNKVILKKKLLSDDLRKLSSKELEDLIIAKIAEREDINERIRALQDKRSAYVKSKSSEDINQNGLGTKIAKSIHAEAKSKGFTTKS